MRILKWAPGGQLFFPEKNVMVFSFTPYSADLGGESMEWQNQTDLTLQPSA